MKILSATQTKQLDQYTIKHEPIESLDLMERASMTFVNWFTQKFKLEDGEVFIFCGPGNNGGDGLAIARLLHHAYYNIHLNICKIGATTSLDFDKNLQRLPRHSAIAQTNIEKNHPFPKIPTGSIIIDGIFGSGLNRSVEGYWAELLAYLNEQKATRIAIDIPSGMFADQHTEGISFEAHHTLSFELAKLAFVFPENEQRVGQWEVSSIGLHTKGLEILQTSNYYIDLELAQSFYRPRKKYSHKGTFGHALIMAGSEGMYGAALLTAKAALRAGAGLVSLHSASGIVPIVQTALPEVIVSKDDHATWITQIPDVQKFTAIGIGPGIGKTEVTEAALIQLLKNCKKPLVLDADALNILAQHPHLYSIIPKQTIITPHPKEFERLFGPSDNDFARNQLQRAKAKELGIYIILKGAHTCIATPDGACYFNSTGNPGMATGGSGDVLTGIITALLAQSYDAKSAAILGIFLHGLAGDIGLQKIGSEEALIAGDLIDFLGLAFQGLKRE